MTARPKKGESIRGFARRAGVSYRQARKVVSGKVYEKETVRPREFMLSSGRKVSEGLTTHGSERAGRRKVRTQFWLDQWREHIPQENRSNAQILAGWRKAGYRLPRQGTHGTHRPSAKERKGMEKFLANFGLTEERRRDYLSPRRKGGSDPNASFAVDDYTGEE